VVLMCHADQYPVNQRLWPSEDTLNLDGGLQVNATVASLKQHFEAVRQQEVKRLRGRLGVLSSAQESAIESLTHGIVDQILRVPLTVLKTLPDESNQLAVIGTVHRIFNLGEEIGRSL